MNYFRRQGQSKKYGNTKVQDDGFTFDSIVEHQYYLVLKHKQIALQIFNLTLKPKFPLIVNGVPIVERAFRPDFAYFTAPQEWAGDGPIDNIAEILADGNILVAAAHIRTTLVIADCKGYLDPGDPATRIFNMNKKLVRALYGVDIQIIQTPQAERRQEARKHKKASERSLLRKAMKAS